MSTAELQVKIASTMAVPASTLTLVNNGAQNALIGEEIVGVVDATDLGNGAYQIGPNLVRGMRGSPAVAHPAGETFAAAPSVDQTTKVEVDPQYIGRTVYVRVLSPGQDLDDSPELSCVVADPTSPYVTKLPQWANGETPVGAVDGVNVTFTLAHAPIPGSLTLFVSGAPESTTDVTTSGTTVTFATPPPVDSTLSAQYQYL